MAIYWHWNNILGELIYERPDNHQQWKKRILRGDNCLAVLANVERFDHENNPTKHPTYTVYGEFWDDQKHLEIMLGIRKNYAGKKGENFYVGLKKARLNTYWRSESQEIARALIKANVSIEFYYKAPKKAKPKKGE